MTPKTLLSVEEFAALPDDGMKHEHPRSCQIESHTPDKTIRTLSAEDTLEARDLLPGFQLSVRTILRLVDAVP